MSSPGLLVTILSFLLVIGPLIFVHELGHYFAGRWFGVKADAFSIGFGKELAGWTDKRGTRWKIGWLPLGGYVKFAGDMNPASTPSKEWLALPAEERNRTFQAKPVWQRFIIVGAGPVVNFLFAILLFAGIFGAMGYPNTPAVVTAVVENSPAAKAGMRPGDEIVEAGGNSVRNFAELQEIVMLRPEERLDLVIARDGDRVVLPVTTGTRTLVDRFGNKARIGTIGAMSDAVRFDEVPLVKLPGLAVRQTVNSVQAMVLTLGQLIRGQRSIDELGGPLKIAQISGQQASLGLLPFVWLMAAISINLGFINLLPIPLLDGGHLLFYLIEGVRRKPLKPEAQEWAFRTGLAALLALMIFVTLNDLTSFGVWKALGGLIG